AHLFLHVLLLIERQPRPGFPLFFSGRNYTVVKSGNPDVPVTILERAEDLRDRLNRVGRRAAIDAGMQVVVRAFDEKLPIDDPAQPDADGRQPGGEHLRVADDYRIRFQAWRLAAHVMLNVLSPGFFLTLYQELHIHGEAAVSFQQALDSLDLEIRLSLVIGR